jgi:uncharacterized RDD family membrane protein YckC
VFGVDGRIEEPAVPAGLVLAPIGRRFGGLLIDELVVFVPVVLVAFALGLEPGGSISNSTLFAISAATVAASFVYHTVMIAVLGRTVGKLAVGTVVVRAVDGGRVGWSAATLRALVPLAAGAVPSIGFGLTLVVYATAVFNPLRQGLHDRAGGTLVVLHRRPPAPSARWPPSDPGAPPRPGSPWGPPS